MNGLGVSNLILLKGITLVHYFIVIVYMATRMLRAPIDLCSVLLVFDAT